MICALWELFKTNYRNNQSCCWMLMILMPCGFVSEKIVLLMTLLVLKRYDSFSIQVFCTASICKLLALVACLNTGILVLFWPHQLTANSYMCDLHLCLFSCLCSTVFIIISPFLTSFWNTADELWRFLPYCHSLHGTDWSEMQTFLQPFKLHEVWEGWFWEDCYPTILSLCYANSELFLFKKE